MLINVCKCSSEKLGICRILQICHLTGTLTAHAPITTRNLELYESCMPYMACNKKQFTIQNP